MQDCNISTTKALEIPQFCSRSQGPQYLYSEEYDFTDASRINVLTERTVLHYLVVLLFNKSILCIVSLCDVINVFCVL